MSSISSMRKKVKTSQNSGFDENAKILISFQSRNDESFGVDGVDGVANGQPAAAIGTAKETAKENVNPRDTLEKNTSSLLIPISTNLKQLNQILNQVLQADQDEQKPYSFYINDTLLTKDLIMHQDLIKNIEDKLIITYLPQAVFKVRSVTRCSSTLQGHEHPVLNLRFSPDGRMLASGSGDNTVRIWNLTTETPRFTLKGHTGWVQHVVWSPDATFLCSAGMDGTIKVWDPTKGDLIGSIKAHSQPITSLSFEPFHLNAACNRLVSSSKDGTAKVWDIVTRQIVYTFAQHVGPVNCVLWSGQGHIYTGGRDKIIRMWDPNTGKCMSSLNGHAHWVNCIVSNSDFICRTGPFDYKDPKFSSKEAAYEASVKRYNDFKKSNPTEIIASCSDDFTIIIWSPSTSKKPLNRMTGHQQLVNHISFSPDGTLLASASFDKSVKVWDIQKQGKFIVTLRGHVGAVYQVTFSSDSRKLVSSSRDSTCKVWDLVKGGKMIFELPGHADEVYTCDWAPDGACLASGGKDKTLKIWKH